MNIQFRSPLRLSLAGGGTDLPECYLKHGAKLLAVAIETKVYVFIGKQIKHQPTALNNLFKKYHPELNVFTKSDVSPGAGLGGSGAISVALVAASEYINTGTMLSSLDIGLKAYEWERKYLGQPVGFQDQLVSAFGGCIEMTANTKGEIKVSQRKDLVNGLNSLFLNNFILVETGIRRDASKLLSHLAKSYSFSDNSHPATVDEIEKAIIAKDGEMFGEILRMHWLSKCNRLPEASTEEIEHIINIAFAAGASGAKAIGAGAGGFILISGKTERKPEIIHIFKKSGYNIFETSISNIGVEKVLP
ncbi:hypothetical protein VB735_16490 [Halotia wernerae UHCC 0503]|nr:hypothetical protein [Halotia wernerae UHCC 0503]